MNKLRWKLANLLESLSRRLEWWSECVAPKSNIKLDLCDILRSIEPTETPFMRSIDRTKKEWWNTNPGD